jgi:hypothetical protein
MNGGEGRWQVQILESLKGHYEAQEIAYGVVYTWCPEHVVVECRCGKRATLTASTTTCGECGADHKAAVREGLDDEWLGDEAVHPWRYWRTSKNSGLPF